MDPTLRTILIIFLVLLLIGAFPAYAAFHLLGGGSITAAIVVIALVLILTRT